MAAALVGGAVLSSVFNVVFDRISSPEVINWIRGKNLDKKLATLRTTLYAAQAFLNDAEKKQIRDPEVKDWLSDLKDAVYKADDLLDEVATKAATQKDHPGTFLSRFLNLQDREMVNRMEDIIDLLESILKHKDALGLKEIPKEDMSWRLTTSLVKKSDIYGRDKDKEDIIKLLLDDANDGQVSVIPIVGQGGIGKTTLAQVVYHDDRVKQNFDFQGWVCVSEEFDVVKVTKTILESITHGSCNLNDLNLLQHNLNEKLSRRKFLIVLDDVWNENYYGWNMLLKPFLQGTKGSKILITTRSRKVASVVQTVSPHEVSLLSHEESWLVFANHACLSTNSVENPSLEKIGRKIVSKCNGLPLAAQTLGGLLRGSNDVRYWSHVLKSEIWEFSEDRSKIIPALRISYYYLPPCLKECFIYCSLYPQDYQFDKAELILLWMAQDLLQAPKRGSNFEENGCDYFDELVARSFFQHSSTKDGLYVMHDLIHDLATFYAGEFYFRAEEIGNASEIGIKVRHLSHNAKGNYPISKLLAACDKAKHTRTFLETNLERWDLFNMENVPCVFLSQLKYLRVLSFNHFPLESLPNSIGELIHLRYLDLSHTLIVAVPESLSNLYNLQTLKLNNCNRLHMLLKSMKDLVNLRHLDIRDTPLEEMPKGMGKLKHLHVLSDYVVGNDEENGVWDLGALENLHGSLFVSKLENVINSGEALEAKMSNKRHINTLSLSWSQDKDVDIADSQIERNILDKLQPHTDLEVLSINFYRGTTFPEWLGNSSWHSMTELNMMGCRNCCMLPSLGQLPSLKKLWISKFDRLVSIGSEFYKNDESAQKSPFPSLEILEFSELDCWRDWHSFGFDGFSQLKELIIRECPLLTGELPTHLPALETLSITGCGKLAGSLPRAPAILNLTIAGVKEVRMKELPLSLHTLTVSGCQVVGDVLEAITHIQPTSLRYLSIQNCDSAISFPWASVPASLQLLSIEGCKQLEFAVMQQKHELLRSLWITDSCDSLTSFPLHAFPNLKTLQIKQCKNMKCFDVSQSQDAAALSTFHSLIISGCPKFVSLSTLGMAALEYLEIEDCPEIELFSGEGLPPNLRQLFIRRCKKLESRLVSMDLHSHPLTTLTTGGGCESVELFPKEGLLPASLQFLTLWGFPSLETLNCKGLLHLTSLQRLSIHDCPKLENMAEERLPASLTRLCISRSPLLAERCKTKDPQIWPKISHIPGIYVDGQWIW